MKPRKRISMGSPWKKLAEFQLLNEKINVVEDKVIRTNVYIFNFLFVRSNS